MEVKYFENRSCCPCSSVISVRKHASQVYTFQYAKTMDSIIAFSKSQMSFATINSDTKWGSVVTRPLILLMTSNAWPVWTACTFCLSWPLRSFLSWSIWSSQWRQTKGYFLECWRLLRKVFVSSMVSTRFYYLFCWGCGKLRMVVIMVTM